MDSCKLAKRSSVDRQIGGGFEPLSKGNNFELDCYRNASVLKQGGHKNGHSRLFLGCFWIAPKRSKLLILWWTR